MHSIHVKRALSLIGVTIALSIGLAVPATAGGNSTHLSGTVSTLSGLCGSSYSHVGHYKQGNDVTDEINMYMDVYYSSTAKRNCLVVSHAGSAYGVAMYTKAAIRPSGWSWPSCPSVGCDQSNSYKYYAGPVYTPSGVDMSRRCIDISGLVGINTHKNLYGIHCG